ncbi:MAG TPA: von Willebrand factor type A domain-containing protein, partial [Gemmatimonadaceae bacterium]|nr:von Willebrand factor type A domain-containing protein [Gemmatimonadaceae bacterium]
MSSPSFRAGALLALVASSALLDHSVADARRLDSTVVVGRVTSNGRAVPGASLSIAGRATSTVSASDGRYTLTVARAGRSDRVTLLARRIGYEPWQRAVDLRGDTVRVDVALDQSETRLEEVVTANAPRAREAQRAAADSRKSDVVGATASPGIAAAPSTMAKAQARFDGSTVRPGIRRAREPWNTEAYERIDENPFRPVSVAPLSTFSVDVDRASYSNVRRFLNQGALPPKDAVRIEELVNYFPYGDAAPSSRDVPLRITTEIAAAPWNSRHDLLRIALRAREVDMRRAPAANLVFLVDVSGSMQGPNRLPLVKQSLALLVNELREEDHVAIVVYAGAAGLALPSTPGSDKQRILAALERL